METKDEKGTKEDITSLFVFHDNKLKRSKTKDLSIFATTPKPKPVMEEEQLAAPVDIQAQEVLEPDLESIVSEITSAVGMNYSNDEIKFNSEDDDADASALRGKSPRKSLLSPDSELSTPPPPRKKKIRNVALTSFLRRRKYNNFVDLTAPKVDPNGSIVISDEEVEEKKEAISDLNSSQKSSEHNTSCKSEPDEVEGPKKYTHSPEMQERYRKLKERFSEQSQSPTSPISRQTKFRNG